MPDYFLATRRFRHDVALEPYRLIQDIISNSKDYRLLVTANYTFGGKELELAYRSQGWDLPTYPPGFTPAAGNWQQSEGFRIAHNAQLTGTYLNNYAVGNPQGTLVSLGPHAPAPDDHQKQPAAGSPDLDAKQFLSP